MSEPMMGQITLFAGNYPPSGWAFCDGQVLSLPDHPALYSLLGTTYGGDGRRTFALPDLRGRVPIQQGQGHGLGSRVLGERGGAEVVALHYVEMPEHSHPVPAASGEPTTQRARDGAPAEGGAYGVPDGVGPATGTAGNGTPHENMPPYLALNYIICMSGAYPARD